MPREAPSVAERLRAAIDEAGVGIRELARVLAGPDATADQVEVQRRALYKYMDGTAPSRPKAILIARALGKSDDYLLLPRRPRRDELEEIRAELAALEREVLAQGELLREVLARRDERE